MLDIYSTTESLLSAVNNGNNQELRVSFRVFLQPVRTSRLGQFVSVRIVTRRKCKPVVRPDIQRDGDKTKGAMYNY